MSIATKKFSKKLFISYKANISKRLIPAMNHDKWTSSQFWFDHLYFPALKKSSKFYSKTTLQEEKLTLTPFCCTRYKRVPGLFTRFPMAPSMSVSRSSHIFPLNWNAMQSQCLAQWRKHSQGSRTLSVWIVWFSMLKFSMNMLLM